MPNGKSRKVQNTTKTKEKRYAYDQGKRNLKDVLICRYCNAIYEDKHWVSLEKLKLKFIDKLKPGVCPACHEEHSHISDGVLKLRGSFISQHRAEIENTILNLGKTAEQKDILNRIERIETQPDALTIYTTKNQLAVKIGKKIDSSHKGGKLIIKWSKNDKPVEVTWNKELN